MPFETISANVPAGYDQILRNFYGDYMIPPSEEEKKPHHDYTLFIESYSKRQNKFYLNEHNDFN